MRFLLTFFFAISLFYFFAQDSLQITYYKLLNFPSSQQDRFDTQKNIEIELLFLHKGFYILDCLLQNGRINHKFIIE